MNYCLRNAEALSHAEGIFRYPIVDSFLKADGLYNLLNTFGRNIIIHSRILHEILASGEILVHLGVFDYSADIAHCLFKVAADIVPAYFYLTLLNIQKSEDKLYVVVFPEPFGPRIRKPRRNSRSD